MDSSRVELEQMNADAARLSQLSPGEGAAALEKITTLTNRRFEAITREVSRRQERLQLSKARSMEVWETMTELIDWLGEAETKMIAAGASSANPETVKADLANQRLLNTDIISQKGRARDVLASAKKLLRESAAAGEDTEASADRMEILRELSERVTALSADRLAVLEQALPLAQAFTTDLNTLDTWLTKLEVEIDNAPDVVPGHHPDHLRRQQSHNDGLQGELNTHKAVVDGFERTGAALADLCTEEDAAWVREALATIANRVGSLREHVRARGSALDEALAQSAQFSDKLDGMLAALEKAAEVVRHPEPVSPRPETIMSQMEDNCAIMDQLEAKSSAYQSVQDAAADIVAKADPSDPAVTEIQGKMAVLSDLWAEIQLGTQERVQSLSTTLEVAQRFWDELAGCVKALKELEARVQGADPPGCQPDEIQEQQADMQIVEVELRNAAPRVDSLKETAGSLIALCGEHARPDIEHEIGALDEQWVTVTDLFNVRNANLLEAMRMAMDFHDSLRQLLHWLQQAEVLRSSNHL